MLRGASSSALGSVRWLCEGCASLTNVERRELANLGQVLKGATFSVWQRGTRERANVRQDVPVPQPGRLRPWLCVGDLDDVCKLADGDLAHLNISRVLLLCKNHLHGNFSEYILREKLSARGIRLDVVDALDSYGFDIVRCCREVTAKVGSEAVAGGAGIVLVNCYGGVNRAGAASVMMLMLAEKLSLLEAASQVVQARGTVLTNLCFRRQLVQLASELGLLSESSRLAPLDFVSVDRQRPAGVGDAPLCAVQSDRGIEVPCSWNTHKDPTILLKLLSVAVALGVGERLQDKKGYTLQDWEDWNNSTWRRQKTVARICAIRNVLSYFPPVAHQAAVPPLVGDKVASSLEKGCEPIVNDQRPCSWRTRKDATLLLDLISIALQSGRGEQLLDKAGLTLSDWEQHDKEMPSESAHLIARIASVRSLLSQMPRQAFACTK